MTELRHPYPQYARAGDDPQLLDFIRTRSFGVFSSVSNGHLTAAHAPFVFDETTQSLRFHLFRKNPILEGFDGASEVLLVVSGPSAYISPDWYDLDHNKVPTWNYVAAHLHGVAQILPQEELLSVLDGLTANFEDRIEGKPPWRSDKMDADYRDRMLHAIVPVEMAVTSIDGVWKIGQDKPAQAILNTTPHIKDANIGFGAKAMADLMGADARERS